jgi:hypothetical protein
MSVAWLVLTFLPAGLLSLRAGEDTTVLFGFLNTLLNLLELSPPPTHFAVVLDAPGKTFRCVDAAAGCQPSPCYRQIAGQNK